MNFSTALRLNDVDDYIAPAQSCIKPVKIPTSVKTASITIGDDGSYVATDTDGQNYHLTKAKIELNDCLACTGCITTAETILVSQHSVSTFMNALSFSEKVGPLRGERPICVALSPQSVVSLCATLQTDSVDCARIKSAFANWIGRVGQNIHNKITPQLVRAFCCDVLRRHGVTKILDTTWSRDISLLKSSEEFVAVWKAESQQQQQPPPTYPSNYPRLPIISGICPGWVCYAEKANFKVPQQPPGESFLLKHLSHVRSPQQMLGGLIRRDSLAMGSNPFTVFVMPCYDKKLEASRHEFELPAAVGGEATAQKEVDLVLGTNEFSQALETLLGAEQDEGLRGSPSSFTTEGFNDRSDLPDLLLDDSTMYRHPGSGSGGYAFVVFAYAAEALFGFSLPPDIVTDDRVLLRYLGSADMQEILLFENAAACEAARQLTAPNRTPYRLLGNPRSQPLLSFLVANGFRNIQTVVQQLKRAYTKALSSSNPLPSPRPFDYIEIMACPGGCLNGGAQIRNNDASKVSSAYFTLEEEQIMVSGPSQRLLTAMEDKCTSNGYFTTFRTTPRIEIINPSALKW
nr:unnamed protein product [Spirometra erinaceieuropaei]